MRFSFLPPPRELSSKRRVQQTSVCIDKNFCKSWCQKQMSVCVTSVRGCVTHTKLWVYPHGERVQESLLLRVCVCLSVCVCVCVCVCMYGDPPGSGAIQHSRLGSAHEEQSLSRPIRKFSVRFLTLSFIRFLCGLPTLFFVRWAVSQKNKSAFGSKQKGRNRIHFPNSLRGSTPEKLLFCSCPMEGWEEARIK